MPGGASRCCPTDRAFLAVAGECDLRGAALPCVFEDLASVECPLAFKRYGDTCIRIFGARHLGEYPLEHAAAEAFCATNFAARLLVVKDDETDAAGARVCGERGALGCWLGLSNRGCTSRAAVRHMGNVVQMTSAADAIHCCDKCKRSPRCAHFNFEGGGTCMLLSTSTTREVAGADAVAGAVGSGRWEWSDGVDLATSEYSHWTSTLRPVVGAACAEIDTAGYWNQAQCDTKKPFLCARPAYAGLPAVAAAAAAAAAAATAEAAAAAAAAGPPSPPAAAAGRAVAAAHAAAAARAGRAAGAAAVALAAAAAAVAAHAADAAAGTRRDNRRAVAASTAAAAGRPRAAVRVVATRGRDSDQVRGVVPRRGARDRRRVLVVRVPQLRHVCAGEDRCGGAMAAAARAARGGGGQLRGVAAALPSARMHLSRSPSAYRRVGGALVARLGRRRDAAAAARTARCGACRALTRRTVHIRGQPPPRRSRRRPQRRAPPRTRPAPRRRSTSARFLRRRRSAAATRLRCRRAP